MIAANLIRQQRRKEGKDSLFQIGSMSFDEDAVESYMKRAKEYHPRRPPPSPTPSLLEDIKCITPPPTDKRMTLSESPKRVNATMSIHISLPVDRPLQIPHDLARSEALLCSIRTHYAAIHATEVYADQEVEPVVVNDLFFSLHSCRWYADHGLTSSAVASLSKACRMASAAVSEHYYFVDRRVLSALVHFRSEIALEFRNVFLRYFSGLVPKAAHADERTHYQWSSLLLQCGTDVTPALLDVERDHFESRFGSTHPATLHCHYTTLFYQKSGDLARFESLNDLVNKNVDGDHPFRLDGGRYPGHVAVLGLLSTFDFTSILSTSRCRRSEVDAAAAYAAAHLESGDVTKGLALVQTMIESYRNWKRHSCTFTTFEYLLSVLQSQQHLGLAYALKNTTRAMREAWDSEVAAELRMLQSDGEGDSTPDLPNNAPVS